MKRLLTAMCLMLAIGATAQTITKTKYGVKVDAASSGTPTTEITIYSPSIIRVTKYADGLQQMPEKKSYSVVMQPTATDFQMKEAGTSVALTTQQMTVTIDKQTGMVCFTKGNQMLLQETAVGEVKTINEGPDKGQYTAAQNFLREARIKRACQLLQTTTKPISDIAYECGFSDPKYFSRSFKASTGKSPSDYRK